MAELKRTILRNRDALDEAYIVIIDKDSNARIQVIARFGSWADYQWDTANLEGLNRKYLFTGWGIRNAVAIADQTVAGKLKEGYAAFYTIEAEKEAKKVKRLQRTVLRNRTTRRDAAYVVEVLEIRTGDYRVYTYWGPWASYEEDEVGLTKLQSKELAAHPFQGHAITTADNQVLIKERRSYHVYSRSGAGEVEYRELEAEPEPEEEPEPEPEKYAKDHIYHRLLKRSG